MWMRKEDPFSQIRSYIEQGVFTTNTPIKPFATGMKILSDENKSDGEP